MCPSISRVSFVKKSHYLHKIVLVTIKSNIYEHIFIDIRYMIKTMETGLITSVSFENKIFYYEIWLKVKNRVNIKELCVKI